MRILHTVESYDPSRHGMQQVVKQLSERLVNLGHEVSVATQYHPARDVLEINGVSIYQFRISGKIVGGINGEESEIKKYQEFLINSEFEVITNFAAQQWATDLMLPILDKISALKVFVPTGFSELANDRFYDYYQSMKNWIKNYDLCIFLSNDYQDINFAKQNYAKNIEVIPNGASLEEFTTCYNIDIRKKLKIPVDHFLILHVGSHTGLKGHSEAIKIFQKANIRNTTLLIIGNTPSSSINFYLKNFLKTILNTFSKLTKKKYFSACYISCQYKQLIYNLSIKRFLAGKKLLIKDLNREETISAYLESDLFLFPSNIECSPLVIFEAIASKTFFLSTDVGNVKEIISWINSGDILPTVELIHGIKKADVIQSVKMLEEYFLKKELIYEKGIKGFEEFENKFSWSQITTEYSLVYRKHLNAKK